jgi:glycosyltransferase involved in cell wall biosynthesis
MALRKARHSPPLLCSYHGSYHAPKRSRKPLEPVFNGVLHALYRHRAAGVLAVAEHSRRFLIDRGVDPETVTTIHNGLPEQNSPPTPPDRAEFGLGSEDFVIGVASRLAPEKGLAHVLDAMPAICAAVPHARLLVLGHGPEDRALRAKAQQLNLTDKVIFAGFRADAAACLDLYDVFALPSLAEYHSIALLEAMRASRPIVATTVGGNPESVRDGHEALLVPPADAPALTRAVQQLAQDPARARNLAAGARRRFESDFSEAVMLRRTYAWLQEKMIPL